MIEPKSADAFTKYLINVVVVTASVAWLFLLFLRSVDQKVYRYWKPFSVAMTLQLFFVTLRNLSTMMLSSVSEHAEIKCSSQIERKHRGCWGQVDHSVSALSSRMRMSWGSGQRGAHLTPGEGGPCSGLSISVFFFIISRGLCMSPHVPLAVVRAFSSHLFIFCDFFQPPGCRTHWILR